ncbi:MAG: hypothetical protein WBE92_08150 [Steroidobacteraceae bacterium]
MTSSTQTHSQRLAAVILKLRREVIPALELAQVRERHDILEPSERHVTAIEKAAQALSEGGRSAYVSPEAPPIKHLGPLEREASLFVMAEKFAKDGGAWLVSPHRLRSALLERAPAEDSPFWSNQNAAQIVSLLRETNVCGRLNEHGFLLWEGRDGLWRVVDVNALTEHAAIYDQVHSTGEGGRCRFCRIEERPDCGELSAVEGSGDLTHQRCRPHWLRWNSIASRYRSHEEAAAHDAKALAPAA